MRYVSDEKLILKRGVEAPDTAGSSKCTGRDVGGSGLQTRKLSPHSLRDELTFLISHFSTLSYYLLGPDVWSGLDVSAP